MYIAIMDRLLRTLSILMWLIPLNVFSMDACNFDKHLADSYVAVNYGNSDAAFELLQFIKDYHEGFDTTECDANQRKMLRNEIEHLFTYTRYGEDHVMVLRPMKLSWDVKRRLSDEEFAALALFREYLASKYIWMYVVDKGRMLKKHSDIENIVYLLSELSDMSFMTLLSVVKNGAVGVSAEIASSWAYLWIRKDNPFKHLEGFDFDYDWIIQEKEIFVAVFPDSKYAKAANNLINESFAVKNRNRFLKARILRYSGSLMAGRTFENSLVGSVPEVVTTSLPIRLQMNSFVCMLEFDITIGDNRATQGGFDFMVGRAIIDNDILGVDLLGGLGIVTVTYGDPQDEEENSKDGWGVGGVVGAQVMKRFPVADILDIVPKIQWMMKTFYYENPESGKKGLGMMNLIYAGIGFEWRMPIELSE